MYKYASRRTIIPMWIEIGNTEVMIDGGAEVILPDYMIFADGSVDWRGAKSAKDAIVAFGCDPSDRGYLLVRADGLIMTSSAEKMGDEWPRFEKEQVQIVDGGFTLLITSDNIEFEADAGYVIDRAMSTGVTIDLETLDRYLGRA